MKIEVLFENENFIALNKPSGIHSVRGKSNSGSIEEWLAERSAEQAQIQESGILHRLDQLTSGILLAAKNQETYQAWAMQIRAGIGFQKIYWAYVVGKPSQTHFDFYFSGRYKGSKKVTVETSGKENERGRCSLKIIHHQTRNSLLEVELLGPGRRHQIRAGLAKLGFPIIGDRLYGGPNSEFFGLHSKKISWDQQTLNCPLPASWQPLPEKFFQA